MKSVTTFLNPKERVLHSEQIGLSSHINEYNNGTLCGNWTEERNALDFHENVKYDPAYQSVQKTQPTLNSIMFAHPGSIKSDAYKRAEPIPANEVGKDILFVHGNDKFETSYVSYNKLTVSDPNKSIKTDIAFQNIKSLKPMIENDHAPNRLTDKKRLEWQMEKATERDPTSIYRTTYNAEIVEKEKLSESTKSSIHVPQELHTVAGMFIEDKASQKTFNETLGNRRTDDKQGWSSGLGKTATSATPMTTGRPTNKWGDFTSTLKSDHLKTGLRKPMEYSLTPLNSLKK